MDHQAGQQPPPYSAGKTPPYPVKSGGPPTQGGPAMQPGQPMHGGPMQPGYAANPGYRQGTSRQVTTTTTVVQQQPPVMISNAIMFREVPAHVMCTTCRTQVITATEYAPGALSWLACCGLAAVGCVFGCCFVPFCIDEMKDVTHTCPNCKVTLGVYHRI